MNRRNFLKQLTFAASGLMLSSKSIDIGMTQSKPNIVFLFIDDMGWKDAGCYGSTYYETPNMDKIAAQGMKFTNAYASPVCSPTRACVQTGQYPARVNLTDFISGKKSQPDQKLLRPEFNLQLPLEHISLAEALKPGGYACGYIAKWHLGNDPFGPEAQGYTFTGEHIPSVPDDPKNIQTHTNRAMAFMEQYKDQPFFLFLSHNAVHLPLKASDELIAKYQAKPPSEGQANPEYAGMIEHLDDGVGMILDKIDELNIADNTIVIFYSDNGGYTYEKDGLQVTNIDPLRGGKGMLYEGGIRVPLIVRWPNVVKEDTVCDEIVIASDMYPTFLDMANVKPRPGQILDGLSIIPLLKGKTKLPRNEVYWHYPHYHHSTPASCVRQRDWKLFEFYDFEPEEAGRYELYNLVDDIGELNNLADSELAKLAELKQLLADWRLSVNAQMPTPNPDYTG